MLVRAGESRSEESPRPDSRLRVPKNLYLQEFLYAIATPLFSELYKSATVRHQLELSARNDRQACGRATEAPFGTSHLLPCDVPKHYPTRPRSSTTNRQNCWFRCGFELVQRRNSGDRASTSPRTQAAFVQPATPIKFDLAPSPLQRVGISSWLLQLCHNFIHGPYQKLAPRRVDDRLEPVLGKGKIGDAFSDSPCSRKCVAALIAFSECNDLLQLHLDPYLPNIGSTFFARKKTVMEQTLGSRKIAGLGKVKDEFENQSGRRVREVWIFRENCRALFREACQAGLTPDRRRGIR